MHINLEHDFLHILLPYAFVYCYASMFLNAEEGNWSRPLFEILRMKYNPQNDGYLMYILNLKMAAEE